MNLGDPELELIDPTPSVHALFIHFDRTFFWAKVASSAVVRWSKRMYSSAGVCSYEGRGGLCHIALSEPLLKLRPRKDLVETLLHEMIHAFLFITLRIQERESHGPNFKEHMYRINEAAGVNITIYHSFHEEINLYKKHRWRCNGPCQFKKPHFGLWWRSANTAPGPKEPWWADHQRECGVMFIKFKEPEKNNEQVVATKHKTNSEHEDAPPVKVKNIDDYFKKNVTFLLIDIKDSNIDVVDSRNSNNTCSSQVIQVDCPLCRLKIEESKINTHLDKCLKT